jgi:FkbM family methyltransferase
MKVNTLPSRNKTLLEDCDYLKSLIGKDNPVIFEIGCNDGLDSEKFIKLFPDAEIHCFEPEPRAIKQFRDRINDPRCHLYEFALGAKDGISEFYQSSGTKKGAIKKDWDFSGSLNRPTGHLDYSPWVKFKTQIEVQVRTLDGFCWPQDLIDLIWMDVQGGERNVIQGGVETLKRTRYIYTEFGHWKKPLYEGQMTLEGTIKELGSDWTPLGIYENCNIVLRNKKYE